MKILNQAVIHKTLVKPKGEGVIIQQTEENIVVKFEKEETSFPFLSLSKNSSNSRTQSFKRK